MFYEKSIIDSVCRIPIVDYLASLGFSPERTQGKSLVYNLRNENTASCFVNPKKNVFNDFGADKGSIIRLVQNLHQCNFTRAMEILMEYQENKPTSFSFNDTSTIDFVHEGIEILKVKKLENKGLLDYLTERKIPHAIASYYLQEAYFTVKGKPSKTGKPYFSLAFKNDLEGYELRNKYFKGCTSKHFSFLPSMSNELAIFEGFMDFLSALTYFQVTQSKYDVLILNGITNREKTLPIIQGYSCLHLFLDNDKGGKETAQYFQKYAVGNVQDRSYLYTNYKDFNELLTRSVTFLPVQLPTK